MGYIWPREYKKLLKKKDPLDREILSLVKHGDLDIQIVELPPTYKYKTNAYSRDNLLHRGKRGS